MHGDTVRFYQRKLARTYTPETWSWEPKLRPVSVDYRTGAKNWPGVSNPTRRAGAFGRLPLGGLPLGSTRRA